MLTFPGIDTGISHYQDKVCLFGTCKNLSALSGNTGDEHKRTHI